MAIKLLNFTGPELVFAGLRLPDRDTCLRTMVDRLQELGKITDADALYREIVAREAVETTGTCSAYTASSRRAASLSTAEKTRSTPERSRLDASTTGASAKRCGKGSSQSHEDEPSLRVMAVP